MKKDLFVVFIVVSLLALVGCSSSGGSGSTSELSGIEGASDVPVGNSFKYTFSRAVDITTVKITTFFMVPTPASSASSSAKGSYNTSVCVLANAISAAVTCSTDVSCMLMPASDLSYNTGYTACLTTEISYADGLPFEGASFSFTTVAGSGGEAPTVTSVTDANGEVIAASGTAGVFPTSFDIAFSTAMDDTSVTTAGNVSMSCVYGENDVLTPTVAVAASESAENTYTVTVAEAYKYALMTCTLTVSTNVKNSGGTALASAAAYEFTNACAVGDDFNADSQTCWPTVYDQSDWTTWETLLANALTFNTTNSTLDVSNAAANYTIGVYKEAAVDSSGFEIVTHFAEGTVLGANDYVYAQLNDTTDQSGEYLTVGLYNDGTDTNCLIMYDNGSGQGDIRATHKCSSFATPYIKVAVDTEKWTMQHSEDGVTWTDYTEEETGQANPYAWPTSSTSFLSSFGTPYLWVYVIGGSDTAAKLDSVAVSGITVSGQY